MSLVLLNDQSIPYPQQTELPMSFYDDVSQLIKLFRRQLSIHMKLNSTLILEQEMVDQIVKKKQEAIQIANIYQNCIIHENIYGQMSIYNRIIQRFIGRIKEILQFTNNLAPGVIQFIINGIKKIQMYIHKNIGKITVFQIVSDLLSLIPSYYLNKAFSPQKMKVKVRQNKQNIPVIQKKVNSLDLILQSYKRSFNLLSVLDIDEAEYRALFFSARDDKYKGTNYLQNDMKYRNRFIREQMMRYDANFENYKQKEKRTKQVSNKKQMSRLNRMMSLNSKNEGKSVTKQASDDIREVCTSPLLSVVNQTKARQNIDQSFKVHTKQQKSNLLTAYNFNKGSRQDKAYSHMYNQKQKFLRERQKNKQEFKRLQSSIYDKVREDEFQDFINEIKVKGEFRMKKVLFGKDGKLQLSPHTDIKANSENSCGVGIKNKIIFRKVQENIKRKLNRLTTQPPSLGLKYKSPSTQPSSNGYGKINPNAQQRKSFICTQPSQTLKNVGQKKGKQFTWKDKQIRFLGIKGVNNNCSFSKNDNSFNNSYNIPIGKDGHMHCKDFSNKEIERSLLLENSKGAGRNSASNYQ